ncbi:MAG: hypothetical protein K2X57_21895 [Xanthobacteraceae bacterium]|nr:hypothetical protein [Xanthobacteraceae bacterium]
MPAKSTVLRWAAKYGVFATSIARAREFQAESLVEEGLELVDAATVETVHLVRLKFDARRWFASKVAPRKYGDRLLQEISGPDGGPIETTEHAPPLPPKEVALAVAELVGKVEVQLGLSPGRAGLETRMKNILATGHMPPDLYAAMFQSRNAVNSKGQPRDG